jgi:hypothetical protein
VLDVKKQKLVKDRNLNVAFVIRTRGNCVKRCCCGHVCDAVLGSPPPPRFYRCLEPKWLILVATPSKGKCTLVTLRRTVTPYRDSMDWTRDHGTYQKVVTQ